MHQEQLEPRLAAPHRHRHRLKRLVRTSTTLLLFYLVLAYLVLPLGWRTYEHRHPALTDAPTISHTASGIPGDPLNVALVATETQLHRAMAAARWYPADPITLETSLRIAADTVLRRPYDDAPVSNLYVWGRKQNYAFEQPIGDSPRRRHHVRFWRSQQLDDTGRPLWLGAATLDISVGVSHRTGQITHHIGPDLDAERDHVIADLEAAHRLASVYSVERFQPKTSGRNGGGDRWRTDGTLDVGVVSE